MDCPPPGRTGLFDVVQEVVHERNLRRIGTEPLGRQLEERGLVRTPSTSSASVSMRPVLQADHAPEPEFRAGTLCTGALRERVWR